jgi:ATP-dependent DNA helicase RecQ
LLELRVARERQMLDRLVRFADTRGCRRQNLLRYFGDSEVPRDCKACESCVGSRAPAPEALPERGRKPRNGEAARSVEAEGPFDVEIFEKLRALRTELARETRVPPYVVFHDATLRELARALPNDERTFLAVKGAGPGRWQRYGERVVAITGAARPAPMVREPALALRAALGAPPRWLDEVPLAVDDAPADEPPRAPDELWALCAQGATLAEICRRLNRPVAQVASQLADGARQGRSIDVARLIGADKLEAIRTAATGAGGDVVAVRKRLPFAAALAEIRLALMTG